MGSAPSYGQQPDHVDLNGVFKNRLLNSNLVDKSWGNVGEIPIDQPSLHDRKRDTWVLVVNLQPWIFIRCINFKWNVVSSFFLPEIGLTTNFIILASQDL